MFFFELVWVIILCAKLGQNLREKFRNPMGYQVGLFLSWYAAKFMAIIAYLVIKKIVEGTGRPIQLTWDVYLVGYCAAMPGAVAAFQLVRLLPNRIPQAQYAHQFEGSNDQLLDPQSDNPYRAPSPH